MTIAQIDDMPGLATGAGFFERGYSTDDTTFTRARVRFVPRQLDPAIATAINVPAGPTAICVAVSVSLVDDAGQVVLVGGRGLVFDAAAHSWQPGAAAFVPEDWLLGIVTAEIPRVITWATALAAGAGAGLLAATATVIPPAGKVTPLEYFQLFSQSEQLLIFGSDIPEVRQLVAYAQAASIIDLGSALVAQGLEVLVANGLIAADRPAQILADQAPTV